MPRKKIHENDTARVYAWRKTHPEDYRNYMKEFMRRWRAKKRSQSQNQEVTLEEGAHYD